MSGISMYLLQMGFYGGTILMMNSYTGLFPAEDFEFFKGTGAVVLGND